MDAEIEYERIIFQKNDNEVKTIAIIGKAKCLKQISQFDKEKKCLERVDFNNISDSLHYFVRYELAFCSYLIGNFKNAEMQFQLMQYYVKDTTLFKSSYLLKTLTYNELKKWNEAKFYAMKFIDGTNGSNSFKDSLKKSISKIYEKRNLPKPRNPETAQVLSIIIPGLGHVYAGYPIEGLFNLSLVGVSISLGVYSIFYKYYFTAYMVGVNNFNRFYFGGIKRASFLAEKHNYKMTKAFNESIKEILMN